MIYLYIYVSAKAVFALGNDEKEDCYDRDQKRNAGHEGSLDP